MIKKMKPYMMKYKRPLILTPFFIIGEIILEIYLPYLMAKIVDVGIASKDVTYVTRMGALMVGIAILALIFGVAASITSANASMGFASELRKGIFNKIQSFSFSNIDKFTTASLVTRSTSDITNVQNAYMTFLRVFFRGPVMLIAAMIMAFRINQRLVMIFFVVLPILGILLAFIHKKAHPRFLKLMRAYDRVNSSVQENLIAIRVVKSFVRSKYEKLKFKRSNENHMNSSIYAQKLIVFLMPVMQLIMYATTIAILWFGGRMIIVGDMLTGELISFISYIAQILMSLMMISMVFIMWVMSRASAQRIVEILDEEPDITDDQADMQLKVNDGSIIFDHVSFKYKTDAESNVLKDINFKIDSGQTVAIIGGTGSGKTTLVQLIPRLYDVTEGEIFIGGHNIKAYALDHLRDAVSMVLQQNTLFTGTIKENLKWGNLSATDEEIIAASMDAQAHDFIMSFPEGYDTVLGQGGVNVSGGQKQRLCIARALLNEPKILILDDSTSAVDTATEAKIREAFRENLQDTTKLIIAQRITSVCDADMIIVMDEGEIDAIGTHEELLNDNRIYQEVYYSQQEGVA